MIARRRALQFIAAALRAEAPPAASDEQGLTIAQVANEHLLAPSLYMALMQSGAIAKLPNDLTDYLAMLANLNRARNDALRHQAVELIRALNEAGIRPMLLKGGVALFCDIYRDATSRMIGDLDILVQAPEASPAVHVLQRLGYRIETEYHPIQHAVGEFVRDSGPGAIDLHVGLLDAEYLMPAAPVWARACAIERDDIAFFVPSPTDMVLHNLLHTQIHHGANFYRGVVELRQLYEFATLARHHAAAIDWDEIAGRLARHRLETLLNSYALLAGWLCGLAWPLRAPPSRLARVHAAVCRLGLYWPALHALAGPWANLRFAFAGHRMTDLYPHGRSLVARRLHHAGQFLRKSSARELVWRLFRPQ
jgi:hypothetical protein